MQSISAYLWPMTNTMSLFSISCLKAFANSLAFTLDCLEGAICFYPP